MQTCLLAKQRRTASLSSSSFNILPSSSRASPIRSLSLLSITNIKPGEIKVKCQMLGMLLILRVSLTLTLKLKFDKRNGTP